MNFFNETLDFHSLTDSLINILRYFQQFWEREHLCTYSSRCQTN